MHPLAGGAERYAWEVASRLARDGADVSLFAARPTGLPALEVRDGVQIRRRGGTFTVYFFAALFLLWNRNRFQAVVDCQNGIPFFAPIFVPRRSVAVICVIHHVHQEQFGWHFRWPLSWLGRLLESRVASLAYGGCPIVAVSPSTRADVRRRLKLRGAIHVVPNGHAVPLRTSRAHRSNVPTVAYVGRLVPHKRLELLLLAAARLHERWPELIVEIAGTGPSRAHLERLVQRLKLEERVRLRGRVSDEDRDALLESSWLVVNPSLGEGWGLAVIEANAAGRPALAFHVPGLVDSIVDGVNGWLVADEKELAGAMECALCTLADPDQRAAFEDRCRRWAGLFSWDRTAQRLAHLLETELAIRALPSSARAPTPVTDSATVVTLQASSGLDNLHYRVLPSDLWKVDGNSVQFLCQGQDGATAIATLEELGLSGQAEVRVARTIELLLGPLEALPR